MEIDVQGPPTHQSDLDLVVYLQNAAAGLEWARKPITECAAVDVPWNIHEFFTDLDAAW